MPQCLLANYPQDLDRLEYMNFVWGGDLHLSNFYTINHDKENVIKFTPRHEGTLKLLIQRPEDISDIMNSKMNQGYQIEIVIYDPVE